MKEKAEIIYRVLKVFILFPSYFVFCSVKNCIPQYLSGTSILLKLTCVSAWQTPFPSLRRTRRGSICDMSNKVSQLSYNETILLEDGITSLTSNCKIIYTEEGEDNDIVTGDRSAQKNFYLVI